MNPTGEDRRNGAKWAERAGVQAGRDLSDSRIGALLCPVGRYLQADVTLRLQIIAQ